MKNRRPRKGFTLVEILIVVVILGILAAIVIPQFTNASDAAKVSSAKSQLQALRAQLELYRNNNGEYPTDLFTTAGESLVYPPGWTDLTTYDADEANGNPRRYLQQAARNPFASGDPEDGYSYDPDTGEIKLAAGTIGEDLWNQFSPEDAEDGTMGAAAAQ